MSKGNYSTDTKHYPAAERAYCETTPAPLLNEAKRVGQETQNLIELFFSTENPLRQLRRAQGIMRLAVRYTPQQLERACAKANSLGQTSYSFINKVIKNGKAQTAIQIKTDNEIKRGENPLLRGDKLYH